MTENLSSLQLLRWFELSNQTSSSFPPSLFTPQLIVLNLTGTFAPIHYGHTDLLSHAKMKLEQIGFVVLGGFLTPTHTDTSIAKLGHLNGLQTDHRCKMIDLHLNHLMQQNSHSKWLLCSHTLTDSHRNIGASQATRSLLNITQQWVNHQWSVLSIDSVYHNEPPSLSIVTVCGSDTFHQLSKIVRRDGGIVVCIANRDEVGFQSQEGLVESGKSQSKKGKESQRDYSIFVFHHPKPRNVSSTLIRTAIQQILSEKNEEDELGKCNECITDMNDMNVKSVSNVNSGDNKYITPPLSHLCIDVLHYILHHHLNYMQIPNSTVTPIEHKPIEKSSVLSPEVIQYQEWLLQQMNPLCNSFCYSDIDYSFVHSSSTPILSPPLSQPLPSFTPFPSNLPSSSSSLRFPFIPWSSLHILQPLNHCLSGNQGFVIPALLSSQDYLTFLKKEIHSSQENKEVFCMENTLNITTNSESISNVNIEWHCVAVKMFCLLNAKAKMAKRKKESESFLREMKLYLSLRTSLQHARHSHHRVTSLSCFGVGLVTGLHMMDETNVYGYLILDRGHAPLWSKKLGDFSPFLCPSLNWFDEIDSCQLKVKCSDCNTLLMSTLHLSDEVKSPPPPPPPPPQQQQQQHYHLTRFSWVLSCLLKLKWMKDVSRSMEFLQNCEIKHRDLSVENLLLIHPKVFGESFSQNVDNEVKCVSDWVAKYQQKHFSQHENPSLHHLLTHFFSLISLECIVIDFGISQNVNERNNIIRGTLRRYPPEATDLHAYTQFLTSHQISFDIPQIDPKCRHIFTPGSDMWMYGCVLWELLHGDVVFGREFSVSDVIQKVLCGELPSLSAVMPTSLQQLISLCLCYAVSGRPTFPFITHTIEKIMNEIMSLYE
jgi:nicotinic acid mononucleotide adenylyltransferase